MLWIIWLKYQLTDYKVLFSELLDNQYNFWWKKIETLWIEDHNFYFWFFMCLIWKKLFFCFKSLFSTHECTAVVANFARTKLILFSVVRRSSLQKGGEVDTVVVFRTWSALWPAIVTGNDFPMLFMVPCCYHHRLFCLVEQEEKV